MEGKEKGQEGGGLGLLIGQGFPFFIDCPTECADNSPSFYWTWMMLTEPVLLETQVGGHRATKRKGDKGCFWSL